MSWKPFPGADLVVTRGQVWRAPSSGWDVALLAGTRLRVTRIEERWDNTHAMIVRAYRFTVHLRVLDGPSRGQSIEFTVEGFVVDSLGEELEGITLPDWLAVALSATPNGSTTNGQVPAISPIGDDVGMTVGRMDPVAG